MEEQIELLIDGAPCALDAVPPELKAQVEKSLAAARAAAEKAGAGKARLRINIKRVHATQGPAPVSPAAPGIAAAPMPERNRWSSAFFILALLALAVWAFFFKGH